MTVGAKGLAVDPGVGQSAEQLFPIGAPLIGEAGSAKGPFLLGLKLIRLTTSAANSVDEDIGLGSTCPDPPTLHDSSIRRV